MDISGDLAFNMNMEDDIKHEVVDEALATAHVDSTCDIPNLNNIKDERSHAEPDTYVDTNEDLSFEVEMKEDIKLKLCNEALSTLSGDSTCIVDEMKSEYPPVELDTYVKYEHFEVPSFNFQLKLENFDHTLCVKSEEVDIDIKLEPLVNQEAATKTEMQREKPFQCSVSNYKSSRKGDVQRHMGSYTGEKLFQCDICYFKFSNESALQRHLQIHIAEKCFQCSMCNYKGSQKRYLKRHMRTHAEKKPFQCSTCSYKCSHKDSLRKHMISHIPEKHFENHFTRNTK